MRKALPKIILGVVLACVVIALYFLTNPKNKQDLSFLNYKNLASVAAQSDTLPASKSDVESSYTIDGPQLAQFLDTANWTAQTGITRNVQRDTEQNAKSSIQIKLDGIYLKLFDTDTANIYDETSGKDRYYRMSDGDYEEILTIISPDTAIETRSAYTYKELSKMPAEELLDLFIQNGLVINDDLKAAYTEEELQTLFKEHFDMWHTGVSAHSYTAYIDLAQQTKAIYDKIAEPSPLSNKLSEIPGGTTFVVDIWDRTKIEQLACNSALEKFWEDETAEYYFECIKSHYIIVMDNTGRTIDVVTALNEGLITIETLDKYGIGYAAKPKK